MEKVNQVNVWSIASDRYAQNTLIRRMAAVAKRDPNIMAMVEEIYKPRYRQDNYHMEMINDIVNGWYEHPGASKTEAIIQRYCSDYDQFSNTIYAILFAELVYTLKHGETPGKSTKYGYDAAAVAAEEVALWEK